MKLDFRQRLLTTTLLVGSSVIASPAFAQDTQPAPTDAATQPAATPAPAAPATSQDIVITGTRIPQPNLTSASPVTVLSSQEVKLSGTTRTEDLINSLPQAFATQGSNISNGSTGTASVNLRNLGSVRTLVLINGRRLQPGDPRAGSIADINFIPSSIVKRVDVLTGGASSVYGADAVAGVVNFIMDSNFTGLRIDAQASTFMHYNNASDAILNADVARGFRPPHGWSVNGGAQDISAAFGTNFDDNRGHIMAYATYRKQDAVLQASRDYAFCSLAARTAAQGGLGSGTPPRNFNCGGSATSAFATLFTSTGTYHVSGNSFVPGTVPFNFGPYNFYQRPDERYTFGTFAEYEIAPGARPYLEAMFMNDVSNSQIAPSGDFFSTNTINCDNPLLSLQQRTTICNAANTFVDANGVTQAIAYVGRRNIEGGGRSDHLEHTAFRIVGGIKGDILKGVSYDAYYQFGTTRLSQVYQNDFSVQRLHMALDVIANPAVGGIATLPVGTPICRVRLTRPGDSVAQACVPYNIFQTGGVTPEALAFLQIPLIQRGHTNEQVADANVTLEGGEYGIQTPWSDRGVGLNVGVEYRKESLITEPDASFQAGDGAGQGAPTLPIQCLHGATVVQGGECGFSVREGFAELQVPIVSHSFIDEFTLTGGYRYSDYKVANHHFSTDTYKVEARLAPIPDILARASYNRAVRAPNAVELFFTPFVGLGGTEDPCAGAAPAFTAAQCANTGVTAAQYGSINANPANQYNAEFSGNTALSPETADTYTAGVLLKPRWVPGLSISADYFDIKVKNLVGIVPYQFILNNCATTGDPATCSLIHRQANNGSLWQSPAGFVEEHNTNIGALRTQGIDLNGNYSHRLGGVGTLSVNLVGTWLKKLETDIGVPSTVAGQNNKFDCAGFYGNTCGTPSPEWRHALRVGFTLPNGLGLSGRWRYFSSVDNDAESTDPDLGSGPGSARPANKKIDAQSYFDLTLSARIADKYQFRLGANNILDKEPPIVGGEVSNAPFGNGNTYPQVYDALGRFLFAGVTVDF
jgi:outer membrane receptor protein involved in Fe transport